MMKIYIAAPFAAREIVQKYAVALEGAGHVCTSTWAQSTRVITQDALGPSHATSDEDVLLHAEGDLDDIDRSDAVIALTGEHVVKCGIDESLRLHTGGRHVEVGYALAKDKPVIVLGEPENVFQRGLCRRAYGLFEALELLAPVFKLPKCIVCHRERTADGMDAYDYSPVQVVTGKPVGWYSGDDGEMCPECMTKMLANQ